MEKLTSEAFNEYMSTMERIVKEAVVSSKTYESDTEKYHCYEYKFPKINTKKMFYNPEIVKKHSNELQHLCDILPKENFGSGHITNIQLSPSKSNNQYMIAETFFAFCVECKIMDDVGQFIKNPNIVTGDFPIDDILEELHRSFSKLYPNSYPKR